MIRYAVLCFAVFLSGACGQLTEDEKKDMQATLMPALMKCLKDMDITKEEMDKWKDDENKFDPCLLSCIFKAEGVLDDKGMFDKNEVIAHATKNVKNSSTLNQLKDIAELCISVNKEEVGDGAKGCERAMLIAKCFKKHKTDIGFV